MAYKCEVCGYEAEEQQEHCGKAMEEVKTEEVKSE